MIDSISLSSTAPPEETCIQVGVDNYNQLARAEAKKYINLIVAKMGQPPEGCHLKIVCNPHDYGTYLTVDIAYNSTEGMEYALKVEAEGPSQWEESC